MESLFAALTGEFLGTPLYFWVAFVTIVIALLVFDLGILHKDEREIGAAESLKLYGFYVTIALAFGGWVWWQRGAEAGLEFYTAYLIEQSLAMDNMFVIATIFGFLAIPRIYQHRVLFWGILGVVLLRAILIGLGAALVYQFSWILFIFGAFLVMFYRLATVHRERAQWAVLLAFLLGAALIMLLQVRGARLAIMPAMPAAAWLILSARQLYLAHPRLVSMLALLGSWLAFAGAVLTLLVTAMVNLAPGRAQEIALARAGKEPCLLPAAFTALAALPPARIMSPIDLGAHILLYTPHAVVAAPYHRNQQGVRDAFRFFNDPLVDVRPMLAARGIGLVVLCPAMAELQGLPDRAPDSFASLYTDNALPPWLEEVSRPDDVLKVYAVLPE